jgi:hypothetical protein
MGNVSVSEARAAHRLGVGDAHFQILRERRGENVRPTAPSGS